MHCSSSSSSRSMASIAARRRKRGSLRKLAASSAILRASIALAIPPADSPCVGSKLFMAAKDEMGHQWCRLTFEQSRNTANEAGARPGLPSLVGPAPGACRSDYMPQLRHFNLTRGCDAAPRESSQALRVEVPRNRTQRRGVAGQGVSPPSASWQGETQSLCDRAPDRVRKEVAPHGRTLETRLRACSIVGRL